jgi:hypothetical protein
MKSFSILVYEDGMLPLHTLNNGGMIEFIIRKMTGNYHLRLVGAYECRKNHIPCSR